jgi:hypothetical protein
MIPLRIVRQAFARRRRHPSLPDVNVGWRNACVATCVLIALRLLSATAIAAPTLEVTASRERVYLGEPLLLEVRVGDASETDTPDLSALRNCQVDFLGSRDISHQSIVIINGQMRREGFSGRAFHYKVTPATAGELVLGPVTVTMDGTTVSAPGPTVSVTGVTRQDLVDISVTASRDTVLVDDPFDIRLAVRIRKLPPPNADIDPLFSQDPPNLNLPFLSDSLPDGLSGPDIRQFLNEHLIRRNQPGFTINDFTVQPDMFDFSAMFSAQGMPARFTLERTSVVTNNTAYWEYAFMLRYTPQAEGNYTFGPVLFKGRVPSVVNRDGSADGRDIFAVGPAAIVRVVPPPEKDRPDCYIGAIGSALTAEAALDAQTCNVGDPLTLTLTLGGPVQIRNLFPPKLGLQTNLVSRFDIYDDTVKTTRHNGTVQYAYTLRPRKPGTFELAPVQVAYYDTSNGQYRIVATAPIPLKVRQATEITVSQVIGGNTNEAAMAHRRLQAAMAPAGLRLPPGAPASTPIIAHAGRWTTIALLGPAVFIVALATRTLYRHRHAVEKAWRQRRALSTAKHILKASTHTAQAKRPSADHAFRRYLELRLHIPAASLTPDETRLILLKHHVPPETAAAFANTMQQHVDHTFGANHLPTPAKQDLATSMAALDAVEQALNHPKARSNRNRLLAILLMTPVLASDLTAAPDPEHDFLWNEANTQMAAAQTPESFLTAAATYQKLVDLGVRNANLFFNQGTALLLADKPDDAIQVLLRSERYSGSRPDLRRNLAIAYGKAAGLKTTFTPWSRIVLFWHYGWSCSERVSMAIIAFALIWGIASLRLARKFPGSTTLLWIAIFACMLMGTSVLTTITQENRAHRPPALHPVDSTVP